MNNPLSFSGDTIDLNKIKCGQNIKSKIKIFFSDIVNGYLSVDIGYDDEIFGNYSRNAFLFPTFLKVMYKINNDSISNVCIVKLSN